MNTRTLAPIVLALYACTRQPAPSRVPPAAPIARVEARPLATDAAFADAVVDASTAPDRGGNEEHSINSQGCTNGNELGLGLEAARDAGAAWFSCRSDAGVQLRLALNVAEGTRPLWYAAILQRSLSALTPARRREEAAQMERDARTMPERFASAELAMRNPQRTLGRLAIVRGTVISAQEDGVTTITLGVGPLDATPVAVVYPATAEEWVVAEARVRVGGVWGERDGLPVLFAALIERR